MEKYLIYHQIGPEKHGSNWNTPEELEATPGIQTFDGVYESVWTHRDLIRPGAILFVTGGGFWWNDNSWDTGRQGPVERYCTRSQLEQLVSCCGAVLAWHTISHRRLTEIPDRDLAEEVTPLSWIPADLFAYPYGSWDERVVEAVKAAGYKKAFSVSRTDGTPYTIRRYHV